MSWSSAPTAGRGISNFDGEIEAWYDAELIKENLCRLKRLFGNGKFIIQT